MTQSVYQFTAKIIIPAESEEEAERVLADLLESTSTDELQSSEYWSCEELVRDDETEYLFRAFELEKESEGK
jgi:hypothetical protein